MKLTKKLEAEINLVYETYWKAFFTADIDSYNSVLDENFKLIGTTETEVFFNSAEAIQFLKKTADQVVNNIELRNRNIKIELVGSLVLITEQSDTYAKIDGAWSFYGKARVSSLLEKNMEDWKFIQMHLSFPDSKADEGQTIGLDKISKENLELRDAIKRRTIELEYKNRELEIEAATERVRVQSMAMQHPNDLETVNKELLHQLTKLKIDGLSGVSFYFVDEDEIVTVWDLSSPGSMSDPNSYSFKYDSKKFPALGGFVKILKKTQEDYFILDFPKPGLLQAIEELKEINITIANALKNAVESGALLHQWNPAARITDGILSIDLMKPPDDDTKTILLKMAGAFNQAYTRFLDLQKAEAQAREAHIETALEKVRSRTMGMQKSEELTEVAGLLFKQVTDLGINSWTAGFNVWSDDNNSYVDYITSPNGGFIEPYTVLTERAEALQDISNARKSGVEFDVQYVEGEKIKQLYIALTGLGEEQFEKMRQDGNQFPSHQYEHFVFGSRVSLMFITYEPVPEAHDIFKRFGKVFEQTYTRFLDLQKAEAQAREAQIETALERVRSRSLAMHKSDELNEVVSVVFERLKDLHIPFTAVGIAISIEGSKDLNAFVCGENEAGLIITNYRLPSFDNKISNDFNKVLENQLDYFVGHYSKEEKDAFYTYVLEHTPEFRQLPENIKRIIFDSPSYTVSMMAVNKATFNINDFEGKVLADDEVDIIKRFAKVFDQTYTRFLDLQKAEAQAREAQIELALERVRARTMAMHKSEELLEAANLLYSEFRSLGITQYFTCGFVLIDEESNSQHVSITNFDGDVFQSFKLPLTGDPVFQLRYERWKQKDPVFYQEVGGEELKKHMAFAIPHFGSKEAEEMVATQFPDPTFFYMGNFSHGYLHIVGDSKLTAEEEILLARFTRVFEMTYKRFLDLQKAESQAREAQIQLALERIRARTMAMQRSEELEQCAVLLFQQIGELGINAWSAGFSIWQENDTYFIGYNTNPTGGIGAPFRIPLTEDVFFKTIREAKRRGEEFLVFESEGKLLVETYRYMDTLPVVGEVMRGIVSAGYELPKYQVTHCGFFPEGHLMFITLEPHPEAWDIFKRFTKVFEQTYTRFLDLQKAEAQAREAKIETALEKARSRTMGMHSSDELPEVANVLFLEVQALGIPAWSCGYNILAEDKKSAKCWMSSEGTLQTPFKLRLFGEASFAEWGDFLHSEKTMLVQELGDKALDEHYAYMKSFPDLKSTFDQIGELGLSLPTYQINHLCKFTQGFLLFITYEKVPDAHEIFKRFTKVFEQTYTRFLDLKNAEAREVIAVREASLDRVRGEIASMRTAEDLQRITPLVWRELTALGVPFFRCGLFIVDEPAEVIHFYLSTPDGKPLAALELPFQGINVTKEAIANWRLQKVYTTHWSKEEFIAFANNLLDQGQIKNTSTYLGGSEAPESLTLQFVPFKQGMLYVGSENILNELQIESVKALANAFSTAYARYEDFIKLESAKQQIEKTLEELKATQKQLIQSEKMASLGELTAGIAHEIQNPLNFVNNFSEVSTELVDEMNEEIAKGNLEDAKQIAEDLKQNLQKINHHGKRAGDIVKGMLQHSRNTSNTTKEPTDINKLADEYLRLAYHGLRAKDKSFNATMKTNFDKSLSADDAGIGKINIIPQDIGRVILNLITNAFYVVNEKKKSGIEGYEPTVSLSTKKENNKVLITVKDNGNGISQKILDKIFQPFFTTKPTGQGTGLGLSLSYDIVKAHGGELKVETNPARTGTDREGEGSEFIIQLPV